MKKISLRIVINEEVLKLINEGREYNDDEVLDLSKVDLQSEYDKLNQLLFNNSLPKIPLKWNNRKSALGHVHSMRNRRTGERIIDHLAITSYFILTYKKFKSVLAHEMIHIKQIVDKTIGNDPHGWDFHREMNRINNLGLGFEIERSNGEDLEMSDKFKSKMKTTIAVIINIDGKYFLNTTTPQTYLAQANNLFNVFETLIKRGKYKKVELTIVESNNNKLMSFKSSKSYERGLSYAPLSDDLRAELLGEKIIKRITFEAGKPTVMNEADQSSGDWIEDVII